MHRLNVLTGSGGLWVVGALISLAAGCSTIRAAREAQSGVSVPPGERTLTAAEVGLTSNRVLTLNEALALAVEYHPQAVQAARGLEVAVIQLGQARSAYGPTIGASAGASRSSTHTEEQPSGGGERDSYNASLKLDLLLFDFGRTPAAVRQATARVVAAEENLRAVRNERIFMVRSAYLTLCRIRDLRQVAEEAVAQYRARLAQAKAFAEAGRSIRYDVTKAEVDLGNAELDLINVRHELSNARAALNRSLGLAEEPGYGIEIPPPDDVPGDPEVWMILARRSHPGLAALRAQERMASAVVDAAVADLYPSLGVNAQYGGNASELPLVWNWSLGLSAALSLFTSWRQTDQVDEAVLQLRSARAKVAEREQLLWQELSEAQNLLEAARQRLELSELIVRQARESLDLVGERYSLKAASAVELTDAQVALTRAQAERVKARFDLEAAVARIRYAIGE